jgi:hypothetical protein
VTPDDWPVFADAAYAVRTEALDDPYLRALVEPLDRHVLVPDSQD